VATGSSRNLPAGFDAAAVRQPYVQHRDVGAGGRNPYHRVGRRTGLADHLDVGLDRRRLVDATPDDLVVVQQE
jgi:hypothetical protein